MAKYDTMFDKHERFREKRQNAAIKIFDMVRAFHTPKSVVDVGCGKGFFLNAAQPHCDLVQGVEGDWVEEIETEISRDVYTIADLEQPLSLPRRFDLCSSLEVGEHLTKGRAESFVSDLCALSDWVLYSAAIPGQGGHKHINLQWQSYWAELFAANGYRCYDALRGKLRGDDDIMMWFQQNLLLYVHKDAPVPDTLKPFEIAPSAASYALPLSFERHAGRFRKKMLAAREELSALKSAHGIED